MWLSAKCGAIRAELIISFALGHSTRVFYIVCISLFVYKQILWSIKLQAPLLFSNQGQGVIWIIPLPGSRKHLLLHSAFHANKPTVQKKTQKTGGVSRKSSPRQDYSATWFFFLLVCLWVWWELSNKSVHRCLLRMQLLISDVGGYWMLSVLCWVVVWAYGEFQEKALRSKFYSRRPPLNAHPRPKELIKWVCGPGS